MKDRRKMIEKEIGIYGEDVEQHLREPLDFEKYDRKIKEVI